MPSLVSCSSSGWSSAPVVIEGTGGPRGTPRCVRARAERPSPCPATHVDSHDWPEVVARDAPFRIRLPRGVREIPGSTRQIWRLPFGTVSYGLVERSRSWLDSISADSTRSPYWICTDSTEGALLLRKHSLRPWALLGHLLVAWRRSRTELDWLLTRLECPRHLVGYRAQHQASALSRLVAGRSTSRPALLPGPAFRRRHRRQSRGRPGEESRGLTRFSRNRRGERTSSPTTERFFEGACPGPEHVLRLNADEVAQLRTEAASTCREERVRLRAPGLLSPPLYERCITANRGAHLGHN